MAETGNDKRGGGMILARVTVVANRKGGTAKTTTVVNLAHEIARCNKRVLVIDCDNQGQVEEGFKAMCKDAELTSPGWLQNQSFFKGLAKVSEYLHICQPNQEKFIAPDDLTWLGALVDHASVQQDYDYVVIDTPPTLGTVLLGAMSVADTIVVPAEPTPLASSGVIKLVNTCMQAVRKRQLKAQQILLLPVMVDKQLKLHRQILQHWEARFGQRRILPFIRRNITLAEAFASQQPVQLYAPDSNGARDYQQLCSDFMQYV
jgi:chromosome partitioning protein